MLASPSAASLPLAEKHDCSGTNLLAAVWFQDSWFTVLTFVLFIYMFKFLTEVAPHGSVDVGLLFGKDPSKPKAHKGKI